MVVGLKSLPIESTETYVAPVVQVAHAQEKTPETLQEMATRIAIEHKIATSSFHSLINSESEWNPSRTSPEGDRGILQISNYYHPEVSDECAFDPACAMDWSAKRIAAGYGYEWVPGNCYLTVKLKIKNLPKMAEIVPNTQIATGTVAIFQYKEKHVAYVESVSEDTFVVYEGNYKPFVIERRTVKKTDPALVGFFKIQ